MTTTDPIPLSTKGRYTIPGLDGTWTIGALETTDMGADGRATLHLNVVPDAEIRDADTETEPPVPKVSNVVWSADPAGYRDWSETERLNVETFLRAHGIDPLTVPVGAGATGLTVRLLPSGDLELSLWVFDQEDGRTVVCPHCPACVKQTRVTRTVTTSLPAVSTTWRAADFALDGES